MRTTGTYVTTTTLGEAVQAFVPHALPPADPPLAADSYTATNHRAEMALARLGGVAGLVPSVDWLLYSAIRKEALLTSQIEGTQATLTDLFDDEAGQVAGEHGRCRGGHQLPARLPARARQPAQPRPACRSPCACCATPTGCCSTAHAALASSQASCAARRTGSAARGRATRRSCRRHQTRCRGCWPTWSASSTTPEPALPPLVRVALVHVQFETIHPFLDGNGRIGRLLIAALLEHWGLLPEPLMYLSGYLKQHQAEYYRRLSAVRDRAATGKAGWPSFWKAWRLRPPRRSAASSPSPA